jgi:hypothetical protein
MSDFTQSRNNRGRFAPGNPANPGGLSRRQRTVLKLIEGLTPKAVRVMEDTLNGGDAKLAFEAAREIIRRSTPNANRSPSVNVAVQNIVGDGALQEAVAVAQLRQLFRAGRITHDEMMAARGGRPALAAPNVIDVEAVPVLDEPADELDRLAAEMPDDEDEDQD